MDSIWLQTARMPTFEPLRSDLKTGVLIIGGGMAGLLCAYKLAQAGVDYALVEACRICGGITKNTTAKITSQHALIYDKLIREFGVERARLYLEANQAALEDYRALCRDLDCDFEEKDAFVYSLDSREKLERELKALTRLGFTAEFSESIPLPFPVAGAVEFERQAQFHPLKFIAAIAGSLRIFEHTKVLELAPGKAVTNHGTISARKIIVATHFPLINKHGGYFLKLYQHRSYVLALKNAPDVNGMYLDEDDEGLSFRNYNGLLLLGGGSHRTGKRGGGWRDLERFVRRHYPNAIETARWATQDCMTLDGVPYIGPYSRKTSGLYVATGFNKWGMTSSMVAAALLADLILGRDNPYAAVFSPSRTIFRSQLAVNGLETTLGMLTPTAPRCPHMGCALKYRGADCSASVHLAAGLPLTSFGRDMKKFRAYLLRDGQPVSFRYEGSSYTVTIAEVSLFPQGYAAVLTQSELLDEPSVIVADIGGWTVDLMRLDNRIPNAATCRSLELGMIRCLDEISEQICRSLGLSMTAAQIESVLRGAVSSIEEQARQIIHREAGAYVRRLLSAITESGLDPRAMPAVFLGGGAALLKRHVSATDGLCRPFILDDVCINAKGYERFVDQMSRSVGNGG